jgi:hypothetical protein
MPSQTSEITVTDQAQAPSATPGVEHAQVNFLDIMSSHRLDGQPKPESGQAVEPQLLSFGRESSSGAHIGSQFPKSPELPAEMPQGQLAAREELPKVEIIYLEPKAAPATIFEKTVDALEVTGGALLMSIPGTRIAGALFFAAGVIGAQKHVLENRH